MIRRPEIPAPETLARFDEVIKECEAKRLAAEMKRAGNPIPEASQGVTEVDDREYAAMVLADLDALGLPYVQAQHSVVYDPSPPAIQAGTPLILPAGLLARHSHKSTKHTQKRRSKIVQVPTISSCYLINRLSKKEKEKEKRFISDYCALFHFQGNNPESIIVTVNPRTPRLPGGTPMELSGLPK